MLFVSVAVRVCVCVVGSLVIVMSGIKKCQSHARRSGPTSSGCPCHSCTIHGSEYSRINSLIQLL